MSEQFEVDAESLCASGNFRRSAAASAKKAANVLTQVELPYGMFGDFDEANLFGALLATVRDEHVQRLHADYVALTNIADRPYAVAEAIANATLANTQATDPSHTIVATKWCRIQL